MKKFYTLLSLMIISLASSAQCSELFFSEYSEGSFGNNKYMEIYNPTNAAIDLSAYSIHQIGNGGTYTNDFQLYGTLASNAVFVFSTDQADASILAVADTALSYPSVAHFNGDDCMLLLNGTDTIDQLGERRVDPGSSWTVGSGSTKDYTLVRKVTIEGPDTAWASTSIMGWDVLGKDDWSNIGVHNSACGPLTEPATAAADPTSDA
ncbi:MAG: putative extracellular nuclease, partial [Lentimonas sp.]